VERERERDPSSIAMTSRNCRNDPLSFRRRLAGSAANNDRESVAITFIVTRLLIVWQLCQQSV